MRIAYITAGAAGMYCGSCLHDNTLAAALQRAGHEVALIPTYTPIRTDEEDVSIDRVFFGAVNVYLEQKARLFQHMPRALHWLLDRPRLLDFIGRMAGSGATQGRELGALTLSVLQGEDGRQRRELEDLVGWLKEDFRPEIVHITNSMFLGFARTIKRELGVPVLCSVQGEDIFLDELVEPYRTMVGEELHRHSSDVDAFIATSRYYADHMQELLGAEEDRMRIVQLGITLHGHEPGERDQEAPFRVGFLARQCPEKGLHVLLEAFRTLADRVGRDRVELHIAGFLGKRDEAYVEDLQRRAERWGLAGRIDWRQEIDRDEKMRFFRDVDVFSVPTIYRESKGLSILEAMASGVPVVQPSHGIFPEYVHCTGGGLLVQPESPDALAEGLVQLMRQPAQRRELGQNGRESVHRYFSDDAMATATVREYERALGRSAPVPEGEAVLSANRA
jgi:glycosyltransferase involved in cell wall biosynthesis